MLFLPIAWLIEVFVCYVYHGPNIAVFFVFGVVQSSLHQKDFDLCARVLEV